MGTELESLTISRNKSGVLLDLTKRAPRRAASHPLSSRTLPKVVDREASLEVPFEPASSGEGRRRTHTEVVDAHTSRIMPKKGGKGKKKKKR
jgi:hypothetical protein